MLHATKVDELGLFILLGLFNLNQNKLTKSRNMVFLLSLAFKSQVSLNVIDLEILDDKYPTYYLELAKYRLKLGSSG
jgi:hypothetical protein